jgi:6,7-dimethyl-8-ribityllumazine synthase
MSMDFGSLKVGLCISRFNYEHVSVLESSIVDELIKLGFQQANLDKLYVPGAFRTAALVSKML